METTFRELFEAHFDFVVRTLLRLGVREADVDDVAQELFLAVHKALDSWDRARSIRPWLFGFAHKFAANYRRLGWHRGRELEDDPISARIVDKLHARDVVLRVLDTMDFDQRALIVMHDLEEFSAVEIAAQLNVPVNTVYSRVRVGRQAFREALATLGETANV